MTTLQSNEFTSRLFSANVRDFVLHFVARRRRIGMYRAIGIAIVFALLWLLVECLIDRFTHLPAIVRWGLLAINLAVVIAILRRPLTNAISRKVDWAQAVSQIESRTDRFGQRLQTIATQMLDKPEHRGSSALLAAIATDVERDAAAENPTTLIPSRWMVGPWIAVLASLAIVGSLALIPWLGLPRLLARAIAPWGHVAPVTTTLLQIDPGNIELLQGLPLKIMARTTRLGDDTPIVSISSDGKTWRREEMLGAADQWSFALPAVDRDLQYFVEGGDARSDAFAVRVLRKPAVAEFRIRYKYPDYTGKKALPVTNTDGIIEAPVGSEAVISVAATEPLKSAILDVGSTRVEMSATVEPTVRETRIKIDKDQKLSLEMISDRDVAGSGPATMQMRAVPDLPPKIKFIQPADDLRLTPRDIAEIEFLATDDYGVTSVGVVVQANLSKPREFPVTLHGDPRYREGAYELDLATLNLKIGDMVRVSLVARDGAGHVSPSAEERYILISSRAIDVNAHLRLVEAEQAEALAEALAQDLEAASKTLVDARAKIGNVDTHDVDALMTVRQDLSSAADTGAMLRQTLLKSIVHSDSPQLSIALARWVDDVQTICNRLDRVNTFQDTVAQSTLPDRLIKEAASTRQLRDMLRVIAHGQLAQEVLSENEDLTLGKTTSANSRMKEISQRTKDDIAASATELGIAPGAADLPAQLNARITTAAVMLKQQAPVDYTAASDLWIRDMPLPSREQTGFDSRLTTAAQAEALRPDANLIRARDLQLAGKAAGAIDSDDFNVSPVSATTQLMPDPKIEFVPAMAALQKDDDMEVMSATPKNPDQLKIIRAAAVEARHKMSLWAGIAPSPQDELAARQQQAMDLAMQANADTQNHDYAKATDADKAMAKAAMTDPSQQNASNPASINPPPSPPDQHSPANQSHQQQGDNSTSSVPPARDQSKLQQEQAMVQREMKTAEKIDEIRQKQEHLTADTDAANPDQAAALARRQEEVAQAVKQADKEEKKPDDDQANPDNDDNKDDDNGDSRANAIATIQAAMERLAAMPQQLATAQQSAAAERAATAQSQVADKALTAADAANKPAAQRAADQAHSDQADAANRQQQDATAVHPDVSEGISQKLQPFAPEASATTDAIDQQLTPALRELQQAMAANDGAAVDRSTAASLKAINQVQDRLREAQNAFVERDPLVAAHYFAEAAAQELSEQNANLKAAGQHQRSTSMALAKAWDRSAHQASNARLQQVPSLSSIFSLYSDQLNLSGVAANPSDPAAPLAALRDWGKLRDLEKPDLNASMHESDPPGYEASLKAYFEALNKARGSDGAAK